MRLLCAIGTAVPLLLAAGCGASAVHSETSGSSPSIPSAPSPSGTGSRVGPPLRNITPTSSPDLSGCVWEEPTIAQGSVPPPVCVAVGRDMHVTSMPSRLQPWGGLMTSDPTVMTCRSTHRAYGVIAATCHAVRAGKVTLNSITEPFAGDPNGPPQYRWQAIVIVTTSTPRR